MFNPLVSVSFLTNDSPVTGSLAVYKRNMNKAKETAERPGLTQTGMNHGKIT